MSETASKSTPNTTHHLLANIIAEIFNYSGEATLNRLLKNNGAPPIASYQALESQVIDIITSALDEIYEEQVGLFPQNVSKDEAITYFVWNFISLFIIYPGKEGDDETKPTPFMRDIQSACAKKNGLTLPSSSQNTPKIITNGNSSAIFWILWNKVQPKINEIWQQLLKSDTHN